MILKYALLKHPCFVTFVVPSRFKSAKIFSSIFITGVPHASLSLVPLEDDDVFAVIIIAF